jgi:Predicted glycosyltransferases
MGKKKVLVSIINWNGSKKTRKCIESLYTSDYTNYDVLVIDNASTDNSLQELKNLYPNLIFIESKTNTGFAGGQNKGINFAIDNSYDYIWILNNDTVMNENTLSILVDHLSNTSLCASVSPILINQTDNTIQFCGCAIDQDNFYFEKFKTIDSMDFYQKNKADKVCLWGTAILVKVSILKEIGGFSENYFAYFEDMEFSMKIIKFGMKNMISPNALIYHEGENNPEIRPSYYVYYNTRNKYIFWINHVNNGDKFRFIKSYLAGALLLAADWYRKKNTLLETATLMAIFDAITGKSGAFPGDRKKPYFFRHILLSRPYFFVNILRGISPF